MTGKPSKSEGFIFSAGSCGCVVTQPQPISQVKLSLAEKGIKNRLTLRLFFIIIISASEIRRINLEGFPSGQRGQTVNLLVDAFEGSNPSPSTNTLHDGVSRQPGRRTNNTRVRACTRKANEQHKSSSMYPGRRLDTNNENRGVEQLVARRAHNPKVGGSSPSPATNNQIRTQSRYTPS